MRVTIIDYGMGNLQSIANAFTALGAVVEVAADPHGLQPAERIVLPGVGAFGDGMANLHQRGWIPWLEEMVLRQHRPFLGICLGLQLLATTGTEHGVHAGLNWIAGTVQRLPSLDGLRVPHIGWNDVRVVEPRGLFAGMNPSEDFYFVHSFVLCPEDRSVASSLCDYGGEFVASIERGNLFATQFHPEKSQRAGLAVLRNFLKA